MRRRLFHRLVRSELATTLRERLHVHSPNEIQSEAINVALNGESMLCVAQTGSGKTLVSLLPILEKLASLPPNIAKSNSTDALLLAPSDILGAQHAAIATELANSLLPHPPTVWHLSNSSASPHSSNSSGRTLIVSTADEVQRRIHSGNLCTRNLGIVAIDEADAILCGPSPYEPTIHKEGLALLNALEQSSSMDLQYLLTTAVLTDAHERALLERFNRHKQLAFVRQRSTGGAKAGSLVPSLKQRFHYVQSHKKDTQLIKILSKAADDEWLSKGAVLVFCREVADANRLAALIATELPNSWRSPLALHDELSDSDRDAALNALRSQTCQLLVCTGVAIRGLDLHELRHVVLYDVPTDVPGYVHAAGRTARRGRDGFVTCLVESHAQASQFRQLHALQQAPRLTFAAGREGAGHV